ncbi:MAG: chromosomal replication initiator protein DnaA [Patescibacteria group bacterium]|nr:chromosomal replication initiator protein DnaA [Patescibacteria group bacterium]
MDKKYIWQAVLGEIEVTISKGNFVTWFNNTYISSIKNGEVIIAVPNGFSKEWLENKYGKFIKESILNHYKDVKSIEYQITPVQKPSLQSLTPVPKNTKINNSTTNSTGINKQNLNGRYTFENLVTGSHNELAKAACESITESPGERYNPLFIYGGVGLGKTHLLQAIGNNTSDNKRGLKVRYVTSEKFTTEFIDSIKGQRVDKFKDDYKNIDILLIDDIQFIGGKEKTQEEFFHIFNTLYQEDKQIVICSDRPPKSIATLEERLRSRFEGGMIVDISKPDIETRIAILMQKIKNLDSHNIPRNVLEYIARNVPDNIRELEGALNKYIAVCQLKKLTFSLKNAQEILGDSFSKIIVKTTTPNKIIESVATFYNIKPSEITGKSRKSNIIKPRQIVIYFMREELKLSYPCIGKELGGRDHATIIHAYNKVKSKIKNNLALKQEISTIREQYLY